MDPWRYTCARCGAHHVRGNVTKDGWRCKNADRDHHTTPAIWDKKREAWIHAGPEQETTDRYSAERGMKSWPGGGLK